MISYLKGTVLEKRGTSITLDVRDVGYSVFVPARHLAAINAGDDASLFIHTHVREDSLSLYGFSSAREVDFFRLLLTVSGIGPRVGMDIMNMPLPEVQKAIRDGKTAWLVKIPGLGKKTAERLIVDLKDKITDDATDVVLKDDMMVPQEVVDALTGLGYQRRHITVVFKDAPDNLRDAEELVKYFLQNISQRF